MLYKDLYNKELSLDPPSSALSYTMLNNAIKLVGEKDAAKALYQFFHDEFKNNEFFKRTGYDLKYFVRNIQGLLMRYKKQ